MAKIQQLIDRLSADGSDICINGNQPFLLTDSAGIWLVRTGHVDIFYAATRNGEPGARQHIFRAEPGDAVCGMVRDPAEGEFAVIASGTRGTCLLAVDPTAIAACGRDPGLTPVIEGIIGRWLTSMLEGLLNIQQPDTTLNLQQGQEITLDTGDTAGTDLQTVWLVHVAGASTLNGNTSLPAISGDQAFPISRRLWLQAREPAKVTCIDIKSRIVSDGVGSLVAPAHRMIQAIIVDNLERIRQQERQRAEVGAAQNGQIFHNALSRFANILQKFRTPPVTDTADSLLAACQLVGNELGITFRQHPDRVEGRPQQDPLGDIAAASQIRTRAVLLRDDWLRQDNGPLLAYFQDDHRPAALLPGARSGYVLHDIARAQVTQATAEVAAELEPIAFTFYRPFPARPLKMKDVMAFAAFACQRDMLLLIAVGVLTAIVGVVTPLATGAVFDIVIPGADRFMLLQVTVALVVCTVASMLFAVAGGLTTIRLSAKSESSTQAAIWDRLLSLPVPFFRDYTSGDLSERAMGIEQIRMELSGTTMSTMFAGLFSFGNYLLLYYYSVDLALKATCLVAIAILISSVIAVSQIREQRLVTAIEGRLTSIVYQLISGISKFRVAGGEERAFAYWAHVFEEKKKVTFRDVQLQNYFTVFNSVYPVICAMCIFFMILKSYETATVGGGSPLSVGDFLAFNAAFTLFLTGTLSLVNAVIGVANVIPLYERARPILEAVPETNAAKPHPGRLSGRVEVAHVLFRYADDGPIVLNDVSFEIRAGEFVAVVGSSGSGKSTLLRLLLGFESPESGAVYYDGRELDNIDIRAVRRQIGVVLQNGRILPGDLFKNIVGSSQLTLEDAWRAVDMVGFGDDIRAMPMGMHTIVSEGGSTLSGGQRQRLMIARALVKQPKMIYFDEATSALDNQTQLIVSESLEKLKVSRLVIAHRLSTIINADKIIVLERGEITEAGTYEQLMKNNGRFAALAKRQLA